MLISVIININSFFCVKIVLLLAGLCTQMGVLIDWSAMELD